MSESERSGGYSKDFGTPDESPLSRSDAAELEQLRREASVLREQLKDTHWARKGAAGASSGRSARDDAAARKRASIRFRVPQRQTDGHLKRPASSCWHCARKSIGWGSHRAATGSVGRSRRRHSRRLYRPAARCA